jgi:hypothetical protein
MTSEGFANLKMQKSDAKNPDEPLNFCMPNLAKILKIKLLTIYVLRLLNPLTCDLHNFIKIHFQIKPPSANHLHFQ